MSALVPSHDEVVKDSKEAKILGDDVAKGEETDDNAEVVDVATGLPIDGYTRRDAHDMARMGKEQELMRNFRRVSSFSFVVILTATWEYILM
jgi:hypothetical protein